jgi:hypothetical protein
MNENQNNKLEFEDQLANYTDLILSKKNDKKDESTFAQDPDLRALEETVLRLKNTFSEDGPSEAVIRRMQKNITREWQQQKIKASQPFWEKWFAIFQPNKEKWQSQRSHQRSIMFSYIAIVVGLLLISILLFNGVYSGQPATSGHNLNIALLFASGGLVLLVFLLYHHKK